MKYLELGKWTAWSSWTSCSASCGFGERNQSRSCSKSSFDALDCPVGETNRNESCYLQKCQGKWAITFILNMTLCQSCRFIGLVQMVNLEWMRNTKVSGFRRRNSGEEQNMRRRYNLFRRRKRTRTSVQFLPVFRLFWTHQLEQFNGLLLRFID